MGTRVFVNRLWLVATFDASALDSPLILLCAKPPVTIFASVTEPSVGARASVNRLSLVSIFDASAPVKPVIELCAKPPVAIDASVTDPAEGARLFESLASFDSTTAVPFVILPQKSAEVGPRRSGWFQAPSQAAKRSPVLRALI